MKRAVIEAWDLMAIPMRENTNEPQTAPKKPRQYWRTAKYVATESIKGALIGTNEVSTYLSLQC